MVQFEFQMHSRLLFNALKCSKTVSAEIHFHQMIFPNLEVRLRNLDSLFQDWTAAAMKLAGERSKWAQNRGQRIEDGGGEGRKTMSTSP